MYKYKYQSYSKLVAIKLSIWQRHILRMIATRGLGEKHLVTTGVAWRPVRHTGAAY